MKDHDHGTPQIDDEARIEQLRAEHVMQMGEMLQGAGELGPALFTAYDAALDAHPDLGETAFRIYEPRNQEATMGARMVYRRKDGVPMRGIAIEATPTISELQDRIDNDVSGMYLADFLGKKLGMPTDRVSPELFAQFVLLHELGHVNETFNGESPEERADRRAGEMATLPVPKFTPSELERVLFDPSHFVYKWYEGEQPKLQVGGIHTKSDLLNRQREAYRALPTEAYADRFALKFFSSAFRESPRLGRIATATHRR